MNAVYKTVNYYFDIQWYSEQKVKGRRVSRAPVLGSGNRL